MRIAVIQHLLRGDSSQDAKALADAARVAVSRGADVVVAPRLGALSAAGLGAVRAATAQAAPQASVLAVDGSRDPEAEIALACTPLGRTVSLQGDRCIDPEVRERVRSMEPHALLWQPEAESVLQAEAIVELALEASRDLAGVVIVVAAARAHDGEEAFPSSAVAYLGELLAEAVMSDEVITADVVDPIPLPDPPVRMGPLPPLLQQRLDVHGGRKVVQEWPADLA